MKSVAIGAAMVEAGGGRAADTTEVDSAEGPGAQISAFVTRG